MSDRLEVAFGWARGGLNAGVHLGTRILGEGKNDFGWKAVTGQQESREGTRDLSRNRGYLCLFWGGTVGAILGVRVSGKWEFPK